MVAHNLWTKIKRRLGLDRHHLVRPVFARVRFGGKLYPKKLQTTDLALPKRKLRSLKDDLERTDASKGNTSSAKVLEDYFATLNVRIAAKLTMRG